MSNQRPYHNSRSSSGSIPYSSYSSLANAGMSYGPSKSQSNSSSGHYPGAIQYSSSGRGHVQSSPQAYQQGSGSQGYGMAAPAMSHAPMPNYNGASNNFAQYPTTPYTSMSGAQYANPNMQYPGSHSQQQFPPSSLDEYIVALGGPGATSPMSPYGSSPSQHQGNYPYPTTSSTVPPNQYMASGASAAFEVGVLGGPKQCYHCGAKSTPLWRRDPETHRTLCNACGLYLQQRHAQRPQQLIDADHDEEEGSDSSDGAPEGPECNHCHTRQTSVWRRDKDGNQVCNACGVYQRLRGKERPLSLKKHTVKPRARSSQT